jgi:hypothetical protein
MSVVINDKEHSQLQAADIALYNTGVLLHLSHIIMFVDKEPAECIAPHKHLSVQTFLLWNEWTCTFVYSSRRFHCWITRHITHPQLVRKSSVSETASETDLTRPIAQERRNSFSTLIIVSLSEKWGIIRFASRIQVTQDACKINRNFS